MQQKITYFFLLICFCVNAQNEDMVRKSRPEPSFWDKVYVGGNLGLQFGTVTFIEVSPLVGYHITEKISAGVGVTYQYYHIKDRTTDFQTNVYGGKVFGRYMFNDYLFGHVEYEFLNLEAFDFYPQRRRVDVESILAGGGYMQRVGMNSGIFAMILYNFTETNYTPYPNPIIRMGINIGL